MQVSNMKMQASTSRPGVCRRAAVVCKAHKESQKVSIAQKLSAFGAAALMSMSAFSGVAMASEFDLLAEPTPASGSYYIDDASVLSISTKNDLNSKLRDLEESTGYRVEVVTVRKLEYETDAFAFSDKLLANWYKGDNDKKGVMLVVTAAKEGAIVGGKDFIGAIGDELLDSIVGDQIPIYTEQEKYNLTVESIVDRAVAQLKGQPVPDGPVRADTTRRRTYRTKEETEKSKSVTATVVGSLLVIAVVVPMLQYYGYVAKD